MKNGFVKLDREICEHALWKEKPFSPGQAWVSLIFKAKWRDDKEFVRGTLLKLKRGQILTSQSKLSEEWGWNRRTVSRFLKMLEIDAMIHSKVHSSFTVITVCNYDKYQGNGNESAQPDTHLSTQPSAQPDTQPSAHSKEIEEYKELNNNYVVPEKSGDATVLVKKTKPLKKPSEISKGMPEWYVKLDTIYLTNTATMMDMPVKSRVLSQIFTKAIAARPEKATEAFLAKHPADATSFDIYNRMLQPYGIAKTLHVLVCGIRPPAQFKVMRETKVEKAIDHARMLLQIDKQTPARIKEVMDWMYEPKNDPFWRNTVMSIDGFRNHFDKIAAKMEDHKAKEAEKIHQPGFSLNHD